MDLPAEFKNVHHPCVFKFWTVLIVHQIIKIAFKGVAPLI